MKNLESLNESKFANLEKDKIGNMNYIVAGQSHRGTRIVHFTGGGCSRSDNHEHHACDEPMGPPIPI